MNLNTYLILFSVIVLLYLVVMISLEFGKFNRRVLRKSSMDARIFMYTILLTSILFLATIFYTISIEQLNYINYIVYYFMFISYAIANMIILVVSFRPLKRIEVTAKELANFKKNLNIDFEGANEFESISKSLNQVQNNYKLSDKKINKKESEYKKFVPKEYLKYFGKSKLEDVKVGDNVQVKLCTMFCDLRNSYYSSETLSLADNFTIIKEFLDEITTCVQNHNGFVDKYMGDGVIAIFDNEDEALKSANEIAKKIDYKNIVSIGRETIKYGISLNSGQCIVGVVGEAKQKQFAVVSDVVNLCSRIEQLNKVFSTRVLMTKQFLSNLKEPSNFKYVGTISFDDITSKVPIFESLDAYQDSTRLKLQKTTQEFESGVRFFEKGDYEQAKQFFLHCLKVNEEDALSKVYLNKTNFEMSKSLPFSAV